MVLTLLDESPERAVLKPSKRNADSGGVTGIHTSLARKDLDKASEKIKQLVSECCVIMTIAVLHDEFGFGQKRCQKFMAGMDKASDYIDQGLAEWIDYVQAIKEELGIELSFSGEIKRHTE